MKRLDAKGWDEIRRFASAANAAGCGGVDVVIPASSLVELFNELDALKKQVARKKPASAAKGEKP